jgi:flavin-dependent dehydrogenase
MSNFDIVVAGGGPAGIAAAITAARAGARVLLAERGRYPRQKVCGEFISAESLDLLRSLLDGSPHALDALEQAPRIDRARVFVGGRRFEARIAPAAASLARYDLDALLWSAAEKAGVDARQNVEIISLECWRPAAPGGPMLTTSHEGRARHAKDSAIQLRGENGIETIKAAAIVNAAGRSSRLSPQAAGDKWIGLKAHFRPVHDAASLSTDLYCFDGGYCGVQPVRCGDEVLVNACALVRPGRARTMDEVLACHTHLREASREWEQACDTVTTGAVSFRKPQTERDGAFLAGDAAGFIDPFVGDGIAIALRSGSMAGEIAAKVAQGKIRLEEGLALYGQRYHAAFDGAFRNARRLRRMLELPAAPRAALLALMKMPGVAEMVVRSTRSKAVPNERPAGCPS